MIETQGSSIGASSAQVGGTSSTTRLNWAEQFLATGGWPITQQNIDAVLIWMEGENTSAQWNPLATTFNVPGASSNFNSAGVKNYNNFSTGLQASAGTVTGTPAYAGIDRALQQGNSTQAVVNAIASAPQWTGQAALNAMLPVLSNLGHYGGLSVGGPPGSLDSGAVTPTSMIPPVSGASSLFGPASTILTDLSSSAWWKRLGIGAGGVVLAGVGLILLNRGSIEKVAKI